MYAAQSHSVYNKKRKHRNKPDWKEWKNVPVDALGQSEDIHALEER